jgi:hypothetical protein
MRKLIKKILKESDEFDWIRDINQDIIIEPNTLYYFEPKLTAKEAVLFADNIVADADNHTYAFKEWLSTIPDKNKDVHTDGGIKYFTTKPQRHPIRIQSWCTETDIDHPKSLYPGINVVDARKEFNF